MRHPDRVSRLILQAPSAFANPERQDAIQLFGFGAVADTGPSGRRIRELIRRMNTGIPAWERAADLRVPTLHVVGLYDRNVGVDPVRDLATRIPDSCFVVFTESAHVPEQEEPERYMAVIGSFMKRTYKR